MMEKFCPKIPSNQKTSINKNITTISVKGQNQTYYITIFKWTVCNFPKYHKTYRHEIIASECLPLRIMSISFKPKQIRCKIRILQICDCMSCLVSYNKRNVSNGKHKCQDNIIIYISHQFQSRRKPKPKYSWLLLYFNINLRFRYVQLICAHINQYVSYQAINCQKIKQYIISMQQQDKKLLISSSFQILLNYIPNEQAKIQLNSIMEDIVKGQLTKLRSIKNKVFKQKFMLFCSEFQLWYKAYQIAYKNMAVSETSFNIIQFLLSFQQRIKILPIDLNITKQQFEQSLKNSYSLEINKARFKYKWSKQFVKQWRLIVQDVRKLMQTTSFNFLLEENNQCLQENICQYQNSQIDDDNTQSNASIFKVQASPITKKSNKKYDQEINQQQVEFIFQSDFQEKPEKKKPKRKTKKSKQIKEDQQIIKQQIKNHETQKIDSNIQKQDQRYSLRIRNNKKSLKDITESEEDHQHQYMPSISHQEPETKLSNQPFIITKNIGKTSKKSQQKQPNILSQMGLRIKQFLIGLTDFDLQGPQLDEVCCILDKKLSQFMLIILSKTVNAAKLRNEDYSGSNYGDQFKYFSKANIDIQINNKFSAPNNHIKKIERQNKLQIYSTLKYTEMNAHKKLSKQVIEKIEQIQSKIKKNRKKQTGYHQNKIFNQFIKNVAKNEIPEEQLYQKKTYQQNKLVIRNCHLRFVLEDHPYIKSCWIMNRFIM